MSFIGKGRGAALIGNCVEYYDHSLYSYLAPLLASAFFPTKDPVVGLMFTFLLIPIGFISRPLGAYMIGKIGDRVGRRKALLISIVGMGFATGAIGCIPTYESIGIIAPALLIVCRIFQAFFVGAEYNGGAIYILEHTPRDRHGFMSGMYSAITVIGMLSAAIIAWIVTLYPNLTWRFPFYLSAGTAILGWWMRFHMEEKPREKSAEPEYINLIQFLKKYKKLFLCVVGVSGLFNSIYMIPSVFLNSYIPIISNLPLERVMLANNVGLIVYIGSLILFGMLSDKISILLIMKIAALGIITLSLPLFSLLNPVSFVKVLIVKSTFAFIAGAFNSGFHAWVLTIFHHNHRYRGISLGYSLGSQIIGGSTPAVCFWIWKSTHYAPSPSFYLIICGLIGFCCVTIAQSYQK